MPRCDFDMTQQDANPPASPRHFVVMPAGGTGARVGANLPKQYLDLAGRPMIVRSAEALLAMPWIERIIAVVAPDDDRGGPALTDLPRVSVLREGGPTRRDTVLAGLDALGSAFGARPRDWVLVHDAARPGLDAGSLERLRASLVDDDVGGLLALPVSDTVKRAGAGAEMLAGGAAVADGPRVGETVAREGLWLAQTPQMFRFGLLREALRRFADVTDEAAAIERLGLEPRLVEGSRENFKVTTPADLSAMRRLFGHHRSSWNRGTGIDDGAARVEGKRMAEGSLRIGQGYDVHALVPGRRLIIGGVQVPHDHGLLGHSDADVLLHAITDAILGAAGLGDIGRHFPDTDARFAGADSATLLAEAMRRVRAAGFELVNLDATVIAQAPKLAPHIPGMVACIATTLAVAPAAVNVKAKTSERLGFAGRGEGIEAEAVALLSG